MKHTREQKRAKLLAAAQAVIEEILDWEEQAAHNLAGTEAMEASIKCEIPKDALMLRHILQSANRCHSIALHDILILPDFDIPDRQEKNTNPFTAKSRYALLQNGSRDSVRSARPSARSRVATASTRGTPVLVAWNRQTAPNRQRPRCTTSQRKDLHLLTPSQSS